MLDIATRPYVIPSSIQSDIISRYHQRWHLIVSFCHLVFKKLPTLSLYRWFMDAFTSDMLEIGSSFLSRDRGNRPSWDADCSPGITRRSDLAVLWGNGNSNNRIVLQCWHTEESDLILIHRNFGFINFFCQRACPRDILFRFYAIGLLQSVEKHPRFFMQK